MIEHVLRSATVATGALLTVSALAVPAVADTVPEGCVGTVYYACTGEAEPPSAGFATDTEMEIPLKYEVPAVTWVPGTTVGGQQIGGVVLTVGGEITPETNITVGGPLGPINTGVVAPVNVCALVTCLVAGEPVVVPGVDLPVIPVVIPAITTPTETVEVPVLVTAPEQAVPEVATPQVTVIDMTVRVYSSHYDYYVLGAAVCRAGGGEVTAGVSGDGRDYWRIRGFCTGGLLAPVAELIFQQADTQ